MRKCYIYTHICIYIHVYVSEDASSNAIDGLRKLLNYVGGAYIHVRLKYTDRLKILASSWATANNKKNEDLKRGRPVF